MARTDTDLNNSANALACRFEKCKWGRGQGGFPGQRLINEVTGVGYLEANSQEFKAGDFVYLNAGAVTVTATTTTTTPIMGMAEIDSTNVTSANAAIAIEPIVAGEEYIMNLYDSTASNTTQTMAAALVGTKLDILPLEVTNYDTSTTYCWGVHYDGTTLPRVIVTGVVMDPSISSTAQFVPVYVKFLPVVYDGTTAYQGLQFDA